MRVLKLVSVRLREPKIWCLNANSVLQPEKSRLVQLPGGPRSETVAQNSFFCGKTEICSVLKQKLICTETVRFLFPNRNIFRFETEIFLSRNRKISVSKQFLSRLNPGIKRKSAHCETEKWPAKRESTVPERDLPFRGRGWRPARAPSAPPAPGVGPRPSGRRA